MRAKIALANIILATALFASCESPEPTLAPVEPESTGPRVSIGVRIVREPGPGAVQVGPGSVDSWTAVVSAVELHRCEDASLFDFLVPSAWAHVPSSATRLGTPVAVDLLQGRGSATIVGEIAPPAGRYCRGYVILAPADDDVLNFSSFPVAEIEGHSMVVVSDGKPTIWSGTRALAFEIVDPATGRASLNLEATSQAQILVEFTITDDAVAALAHDAIDESLEAWINHLAAHLRMYRWNQND